MHHHHFLDHYFLRIFRKLMDVARTSMPRHGEEMIRSSHTDYSVHTNAHFCQLSRNRWSFCIFKVLMSNPSILRAGSFMHIPFPVKKEKPHSFGEI